MKMDQNHMDQRKLVLYILDEISGAGRLEVETWLEESEENRHVFTSLNKTWIETGNLDIFPRQIDVDSVWDSFSNRLEFEPSVEVRSPSMNKINSRRIIRFISAAAAVVIFGLISITMVRNLQERTFRTPTQMASNEKIIQDTLKDGTTFLLNGNSTLRVAKKFDTEDRKVELSGEAFFEVESDSAKPFIIETELGKIKVLGTSFQVKGFPESDLEVFVEEGHVELSGINIVGEDVKLLLSSGERGIIKYPDGELILGDDIKPDDLFWANHKLIFEETRLSLVFELLKKHYKTEIEIKNDSINDCLLSATFNNETDEQILAVIAVSFDLSIIKEKDKFIIRGKGCDNE